MTTNLKFNVMAGESIQNAAASAIKLSATEQKPVEFDFNDITITVRPDSTAEEVTRYFSEECDRRREEYLNSPEGQIAAQESQRRLDSSKKVMANLLPQLDKALADSPIATMRWIKKYGEVADHMGVDAQFETVIAQLEEAGYSAEDSSFDRETTEVTSEVMEKWVIGNAISCMKSGMPPHPSLTEKFTKEYADMVQKDTPKPPSA